MKPTASVNAIPKEVAVKFCAEIREENRGKWYTFAGMQCKGYTTFSKGDSTKMQGFPKVASCHCEGRFLSRSNPQAARRLLRKERSQ